MELANREVKGILEKAVSPHRKDWAFKLDDTLWSYRNTYKMPLGASPFRLVYGKACHLPIKMEQKSYWASKMLNMDLNCVRAKRYLALGELKECRHQPYNNSKLYEEKLKKHITKD